MLELPTFRASQGDLHAYRRHLGAALDCRPRPAVLAGHSMGAALAVLAAAERPEGIERLILLSPSGLPLVRPMAASAVVFVHQVLRGRYPPRALSRSVANVAVAPRAAARLARHVHDLDLTAELNRVRKRGIPCTVVACTYDKLSTPEHCRRVAALLDADYREVGARDGHIWPITDPDQLKAELS